MDLPYAVLRQPSRQQLRTAAKNSDIVFQNLISLRTLAGVLFSGKPIVVTHQSWLRRTDGSRGLQNYVKLIALRFCKNISISQAIADALPVRSIIIRNAFEASAFADLRDKPREKDLVFLGRLVSDKGCALLLQALAELKSRNLFPSLTVVGDGPERSALTQLTGELGLTGQVEFTGALHENRGEVVARHRIMVVPSVWAEPFGIVALEGIASGCAIVASELGGLPDAAGPCGLYFPNGDAHKLADVLEQVLTDTALREQLVANGPEHLKEFQPTTVAARYLEVFRSAIAKRSQP
jgi:glycosyltransferase involved in cell wall biosynthesis